MQSTMNELPGLESTFFFDAVEAAEARSVAGIV